MHNPAGKQQQIMSVFIDYYVAPEATEECKYGNQGSAQIVSNVVSVLIKKNY